MEKRPLHHVTPTEVYIRVTYALIVRDYKRHQGEYGAFPAAGIQRLAEQLRPHGFAVLCPWLFAASRHVASGVPLRAWAESLPWDWNRAVFKQQWRKKR